MGGRSSNEVMTAVNSEVSCLAELRGAASLDGVARQLNDVRRGAALSLRPL